MPVPEAASRLTQRSGGRLRFAVAAAAAMLVCAAAAAPAGATVTILSSSVSASTTQAGASPSVTVDAAFGSPDGDTPNDLTISLAPGLLADPAAVAQCSAQQFQADTCPSSSQVGDGSIIATVLGQTVPLPVLLYLLEPQGSELGSIGVVVDLFDSPIALMTASVQIRDSPQVGLDISIPEIPDQIQGVGLQVNDLQITLFGSIEGQPFTHMPTSCATTTSSVTITSYGAPASPVSASSSLTPTGCASLAYQPQLTDTATIDSGDDGVVFAASITQEPTEAATEGVTLTLPPRLAPRLSALSHACTATDLTTCPPIGSVTVTTPLLGSPLQGNLVLVANSGSLPTVDAIFPSPFAISLHGAPALGAGGLSVTFDGFPDVPITHLVVAFSGGSGSLFVAAPGLCADPGELTGDFVAQSGATGHDTAPLAVVGSCVAPGGAGGAGAGITGRGRSRSPAATAPSARLSFGSRSDRSAKLTLKLAAGRNEPDLKLVKISLPRGISLYRPKLTEGVLVKLDGHPHARTVRLVRRTLTVSLGDDERTAVVTLTHPALVVSGLLARHIRDHDAVRVRAVVTIIDANHGTTTLHVTAASRLTWR